MDRTDKVDIFGVEIQNTTLKDLMGELEKSLKGGGLAKVFTPNTEIVMAAKKSESLKGELNKGTYVIPDGIGLIYGAKIRGITLKERVTGFDTSMELLRIADQNGYGLYLLGGKEGIAEEAKEQIQKDYPGIRVTGCHHGYFKGSHTGDGPTPEEERIIDEIKTSRTDILFVGFGFPRQEIWINTYGEDLGVKVAIGNGGVIDILAGQAKRAPDIFIRLGLEWFYRLVTNPSRIKRQAVLPLFLVEVALNGSSIHKISKEDK
ncbi:MAG TPA: WecB/TagA/CpsF family glycosyltransferase [Tissierellaceae bacterium]|jgi:N-acetylglucosaminyldiphosphoundecaprenol N-acetyl-beta-D-mannosaminyltransferase|nr:WecB/TagA/CpsF family glycosyltransferase [Tissierellaceae bacterium]